MLRIFLQVHSLSAGKGGTERVAVELADEMAYRNHEIFMGYKNDGPPSYPNKFKINFSPYTSIKELRNIVQSINPDVFFSFYSNQLVLHNYSVVYGTQIPFTMQECSNPVRICTNNWNPRCSDPINAKWEREIVASAAARIRLTMPAYSLSFPDYIRQSIRAFLNPAFPKKLVSYPRGINSLKNVILIINGFKVHKNFIALLKAFKRLYSKFPNWEIRAVGKLPDKNKLHVKEIMKYIKINHLQDKVIISGPTNDIFSEYAQSDIHVIPSLSEGCPTVVLEAMSMGVPSVGYEDCPGTNELIQHEINGLLSSSDDRITGLEFVLNQLMSSSDLRDRLGKQAFEDSKRFEPHNIYDQWEQLFIEAAEYKNDPGRLFREQLAIDPERAMHARRMRNKLVQQIKE
jgi:glycosyltransferase involved in cell wall biosynthesis